MDPQVRRAGLSQATDVVTIGVGGNSLPFAGMLAECVELGLGGRSCREHYEHPPAGEEGIDQEFARIQGEHVGMLARVHEAAPSAKVITVGYPAVLPQQGADCAIGEWTELVAIGHADVEDCWPTEIRVPNLTVPCPDGTHAALVHPNARHHDNVSYHVERVIRLALLEH